MPVIITDYYVEINNKKYPIDGFYPPIPPSYYNAPIDDRYAEVIFDTIVYCNGYENKYYLRKLILHTNKKYPEIYTNFR
jgi:hypothetical protein